MIYSEENKTRLIKIRHQISALKIIKGPMVSLVDKTMIDVLDEIACILDDLHGINNGVDFGGPIDLSTLNSEPIRATTIIKEESVTSKRDSYDDYLDDQILPNPLGPSRDE